MIVSLRRRHIYIHKSVRFNRSTYLCGYNKIHKGTSIVKSFIGRNTYIGENCCLNNVRIGNFCSIANNIRVESSVHPTHTFVSTSPVFYSTFNQTGQSFVETSLFNEFLTIDGRNCIIGNDVWIGTNVLIKGGIRIGDGAIIAMGAVVTKDVEPYSIVAGVPAKEIRKRFTNEEIEYLIKSGWWDKEDVFLKQNVESFSNIMLYTSKDL